MWFLLLYHFLKDDHLFQPPSKNRIHPSQLYKINLKCFIISNWARFSTRRYANATLIGDPELYLTITHPLAPWHNRLTQGVRGVGLLLTERYNNDLMESLTHDTINVVCGIWFHWIRLVYRSRLLNALRQLQNEYGSHGPISIALPEILFHSFFFFVPLFLSFLFFFFFALAMTLSNWLLVCALLSAFIVLLWGFVTVIVRSNVA